MKHRMIHHAGVCDFCGKERPVIYTGSGHICTSCSHERQTYKNAKPLHKRINERGFAELKARLR